MDETFRPEKLAYWYYHSEVPKELREYARRAPDFRYFPLSAPPELAQVFEIHLRTAQYIPSHVVTLRTEIDGWGRDLHGVYRADESRDEQTGVWSRSPAWRFVLDLVNYPAGFHFKFVLDGEHWMLGDNLWRDKPGTPDQNGKPMQYVYDESQVAFVDFPARYLHGYDNLRIAEDGRQQELTHSSYDETTEHDVIIIGSGMGGGILADALTDRDRDVRVLVLDAGSLDYSTHIYNLPGSLNIPSRHEVGHYEREGDTDFGMGVQMGLGGRSVFWSAIIPQMQAWEMKFWPTAVSLNLAGSDYARAEKLMRKHKTFGDFEKAVIADLGQAFPEWKVEETPTAEDQPYLGANSFFLNSTGTFSTAELLVDSLTTKGRAGRDNLRINLNHLVTRLEHAGGRITSVTCRDLAGNRERTYLAKKVVLAAGSLESPKIALRSGLHDPHQLVGRGLTDHTAFYTRAFEIPASHHFGKKDQQARVFFYPTEKLAGPHRFNIEMGINTDFWRERHADDDVWEQRQQEKKTATIELKARFASPLRDENYVRLDPSTQKLKLRVVRNCFGEEAKETVKAIFAAILDRFEVKGYDLNNNDHLWFGAGGTVNHSGGSLRMPGRNPIDGSARLSVVDENLRYEGHENLYVADVSVFPFIPAANPSLTLAALVLRLADHLAEKLKKGE